MNDYNERFSEMFNTSIPILQLIYNFYMAFKTGICLIFGGTGNAVE